MDWSVRFSRSVTFQAKFTKEGKLTLQKTLLQCLKISIEPFQATLDNWLPKNESRPQVKEPENRTEMSNKHVQKFSEDFLRVFDDTISCIELEMKHDKSGNVIGWMRGDPKVDEWDGSTDNRIKALEDHVSKKGWLF